VPVFKCLAINIPLFTEDGFTDKRLRSVVSLAELRLDCAVLDDCPSQQDVFVRAHAALKGFTPEMKFDLQEKNPSTVLTCTYTCICIFQLFTNWSAKSISRIVMVYLLKSPRGQCKYLQKASNNNLLLLQSGLHFSNQTTFLNKCGRIWWIAWEMEKRCIALRHGNSQRLWSDIDGDSRSPSLKTDRQWRHNFIIRVQKQKKKRKEKKRRDLQHGNLLRGERE